LTQEPKIKTMLKGLNEKLNSSNQLEASGIAENAKLGRWYKPVSIATEQTRESTSYGTLTTPDEIKEVVLPENGLIAIGYMAKWQSSVSANGNAAIFIGANQVKNTTIAVVQEVNTSGTELQVLATSSFGLAQTGGSTAFTTTGQILSPGAANGGFCYVFAAAGTYNVSIQFKAPSGKVTAKERKLWVGVLGF
jgi:hypothetical protein